MGSRALAECSQLAEESVVAVSTFRILLPLPLPEPQMFFALALRDMPGLLVAAADPGAWLQRDMRPL